MNAGVAVRAPLGWASDGPPSMCCRRAPHLLQWGAGLGGSRTVGCEPNHTRRFRKESALACRTHRNWQRSHGICIHAWHCTTRPRRGYRSAREISNVYPDLVLTLPAPAAERTLSINKAVEQVATTTVDEPPSAPSVGE